MIVYGGFDSTYTHFFECWRIILVPCWWCGVVATHPDRIYAGLGKMQLLHKLRHRMRLLLDCGEEILVSFCSVSGELTSSVLTADFLFIAVQSQMTTSRTSSDEELLLLSCLSRRCSERKTVDKGHCENELRAFSFVFFNGLAQSSPSYPRRVHCEEIKHLCMSSSWQCPLQNVIIWVLGNRRKIEHSKASIISPSHSLNRD